MSSADALGHKPPTHGGNLCQEAARIGLKPERMLDASASLVPFRPPVVLRRALERGIRGSALRDYPDRSQQALRDAIAAWHGIDPDAVLPGNGAAELFTWVARDAADCGLSSMLEPGFADYRRALACWGGAAQGLPLVLNGSGPGAEPWPLPMDQYAQGQVLWITNPHNPTGQLWSRASLEPLLERHALVICDEAFLPLVPNGDQHSLIPRVVDHPNLVVIRSLTKLFAVAGLRLGYAIAAPERLQQWSQWRDPWPVNGLALAAGTAVMADQRGLRRWQERVQAWIRREEPWLRARIQALPGLTAHPSSANYLLVEGEGSLLALREQVAQRGVLLRDCRSFAGLGERWLRVGLQDRRGNRRILQALRGALRAQSLP